MTTINYGGDEPLILQKITIGDLLPGLQSRIVNAGAQFVQLPDGYYTDDLVDVQTIVDGYAGSADELAFHKADKLGLLSELYDVKYMAGFSYSGVIYQIDPQSQFNIASSTQVASLAIAGTGTWPAGFVWIASNNTTTAMTAVQMQAFGLAAGSYVNSLILRNRALKTAIGAAANLTALNAIDITSGWPSGT